MDFNSNINFLSNYSIFEFTFNQKETTDFVLYGEEEEHELGNLLIIGTYLEKTYRKI